MVEPVRPTTRGERLGAIEAARYNLFRLPSELVQIDLLTDSGTAAMSDAQWAAMMRGDEAYAGSRSFERFERTVRELLGFEHVIPTHQGRAAEHLVFGLMVERGDAVPNNSHFDTTRAHVEHRGGLAIDCVSDCAYVTDRPCPFKGGVDLKKLRRVLDANRVPLGMVTVTNNTAGGQPVSLQNLRDVSALLHSRGIPLFLDACRFAENAWLIHEREDKRPVREIVADMFSVADGCTVSAKKDGLANIGGFFACRDAALAERLKERLILFEGFPTYGGLAGRDLDAIAVGLEEAVDEGYLRYRVGQVRWLAERLDAAGVPVVKPPGGHAVFVDARKFLPHVPPAEFPAQALACALYVEGGVRACEIGSLMFARDGAPAALDLVRLAIPRRVYTESHLAWVADCLAALRRDREALRGLRLVRAPETLRHFTAELEPVA
jgi:tryptophanase